jgi:hypothetical protein
MVAIFGHNSDLVRHNLLCAKAQASAPTLSNCSGVAADSTILGPQQVPSEEFLTQPLLDERFRSPYARRNPLPGPYLIRHAGMV